MVPRVQRDLSSFAIFLVSSSANFSDRGFVPIAAIVSGATNKKNTSKMSNC